MEMNRFVMNLIWSVLIVGLLLCPMARGAHLHDVDAAYARGEYATAARLLMPLAESGHATAQKLLGFFYQHGQGVPQNYVEAAKWYRYAAEQGDADAQRNLGSLYYYGHGVPQDYKEAARFFRIAAEQGDADAASMFNPGTIYVWKDRDGSNKITEVIPPDHAGDVREIPQEASRPEGDVETLALKDEDALQLYKEHKKLLRLLERSPISLEKSEELAKRRDNIRDELIRQARNNGKRAQYAMGLISYDAAFEAREKEILDRGEALFAWAAEWFKQSSENGFPPAMCRLGIMYTLGDGVIKSNLMALEWFYKGGVGYLKINSRESSLRCLEMMMKIERTHHLTVKLYELVYSMQYERQDVSRGVSFGTGWVVEKGYIVTNYHVVEGAKEVSVVFNAEMHKCASVAVDKGNDIVLLKPAGDLVLPKGIPLGLSEVQVAIQVFTLGFPHPDIMGASAKFTSGTISALTGLGDDPRFLQISVPIQAGNSGGPLLNMRGEAIGVVSSKLNAQMVQEDTGDMPQNVNYAVKSHFVKALLDSVPRNQLTGRLSTRRGDLPDLARRIEDSVVMVIAE